MLATQEVLNEEIVAIFAEDRNGESYMFYLNQPVLLNEVQFNENYLVADNLIVHYKWFETVIVCSKENVKEIKGIFLNT